MKSSEFFYLEPGIYPSIMDIVEAVNTLIQERHNQCKSCITMEVSRRTQKVEIYLAKKRSGLAFKERPPTIISNLEKRSKVVASRQVETPFYRDFGRQRGRDSVHLHKILGIPQLFLYVSISSSCKKRGCSLVGICCAEFADIVGGGKNFDTAAKSVEDKLWENNWVVVAGKVVQADPFQQNLQNKPVGREKKFYKQFSLIMSSNFRYQPFVAVSGNLGGKDPVMENVLSS